MPKQAADINDAESHLVPSTAEAHCIPCNAPHSSAAPAVHPSDARPHWLNSILLVVVIGMVLRLGWQQFG